MVNEQELLTNGQGSFCDIIKTALYQEDETIFERLDFYNDAIFLEPLLFGYCAGQDSKFTKEQLLFGVYPEAHKPTKFRAYTNKNGVVSLPGYGDLKTNIVHEYLDVTYLEKELHLSQEKVSIAFDFSPTNYLKIIPTIELSAVLDPCSEELIKSWPKVSEEKKEAVLDSEAIDVKTFQPAIEQAFAFLRDYLPNEFEKYALTTRKIVLFSEPELRNFATRVAHGTVYLNVNEASNVTFFLEELVHQCSHTVFNAMTCNIEDFFVVSHQKTVGEYTDYDDYRTLYSALHGIYTTGQIVDVFLKLIQNNLPVDEETLHELKGRIAINKNRHNIGLEKIPAAEVFTEQGKLIFDHYYQKLDANIANNVSFFDFDVSTHPVVFDYKKFKADNPLPVSS